MRNVDGLLFLNLNGKAEPGREDGVSENWTFVL